MTDDILCPICGERKAELYDWYRSQQETYQQDLYERLFALASDFCERLIILTEEHERGKHNEGVPE